MNDNNKLEELSFLLPFLGIFLFSPVLLEIFDIQFTVYGVPVLHIYLFLSWFVLIAISFSLTGKLSENSAAPPNDEPQSNELQAHLDKITKP